MHQITSDFGVRGEKSKPGRTKPRTVFGRTADEREAIGRWAIQTYDGLVRSKYASVVWGRGRQRQEYGVTFWANGSGWFNAGVRIETGQVVVANYLGHEVDRVPLSAIAVQIVALLNPPGWSDWVVTDGVGLSVYADWLDERDEKRWAARIRRWGAEAMKHVEVAPKAGSPTL